jgi:hypothetical protein
MSAKTIIGRIGVLLSVLDADELKAIEQALTDGLASGDFNNRHLGKALRLVMLRGTGTYGPTKPKKSGRR